MNVRLRDMPRFIREHRWTRSRMSDYIDGDLARAEAHRVEEHVSRCPQCWKLLDGLKRTVAALGTATRFVDADSVQPREELRIALEAGHRTPGPHERLLRDLLGLVCVVDHAQDDSVQPVRVPAHQLLECQLVPLPGARNEIDLTIAHERGDASSRRDVPRRLTGRDGSVGLVVNHAARTAPATRPRHAAA